MFYFLQLNQGSKNCGCPLVALITEPEETHARLSAYVLVYEKNTTEYLAL